MVYREVNLCPIRLIDSQTFSKDNQLCLFQESVEVILGVILMFFEFSAEKL